MAEDEAVTTEEAWRLRGGSIVPERAQVIVEEPLQIIIDGTPYAVLMRTPGDDVHLAAGFCLTEGLVDSSAHIGAIASCPQEDVNSVAVTRAGAPAATELRPPSMAVRSSCGLCGREQIDDLVRRLPRIESGFQISSAQLLALGRRMQEGQTYFQPTGGTHAAALFDASGELLTLAEDVGRHNALDKAIGRLLLSDSLARAATAVLSGRCSFEMIQKAARAGIPLVASVSAPTHLAIALAKRLGLTLVGFLRERSLTVYAGEGRVQDLSG